MHLFKERCYIVYARAAQRVAPGPHAAPWLILCGPRALLENRAGCEQLFANSTLCHLHRRFLPLCIRPRTDLLLTPNQCLYSGLHCRRLCTRYCYMECKTYNQSPGPTKSYIYYIQCVHVIGNSFRTSLTGH